MIGVLIVEDDLPAAEALAEYIDRLSGFRVAGHARTGVDALRRATADHVHLVLLDIYLPDISGLEVLRRLRGSGNTVDVVVVTRARDLAVIEAAVSYGVGLYLVKPFTYSSVRKRLERYQEYRAARLVQGILLGQHDIDKLLGGLRDADERGDLPKGISRESLHAVVAALKGQGVGGLSAVEMARELGASRVTARRYLEYLVDAGLVGRRARYRLVGRPELEYTWQPHGDPQPDHPPSDPERR